MTAVAFDISALTAYQRGTYDRLAPIAVVCPQCGSRPGSYCKSKSGYNVPFHKVRKDAVASWSYDERIAAVAQVRAEQAETRRRAVEQMAQPLTVAQQRTRATVSALVKQAYAEADARLDAEGAAAQAAADAFNETAPVGTLVRYWRGVRSGPASGVGRISHPASVLGGHSAVAWISGCSGAVGLTHVEVLDRAGLVEETAAALVVAL
ncbi:hypothetical protein [Catenuloplanes indicus]|uniref:Uncharacterized protein n=1 Tax=Catenuloplanes indicus TaxID=137267 RepID=A0AAE3W942_9ACTN|nr:hypothetical protein [Catenuloplanes indicus]MDQ0371547.1 hypothetical protein [Catenuloplanes indicus]